MNDTFEQIRLVRPASNLAAERCDGEVGQSRYLATAAAPRFLAYKTLHHLTLL